MLELGNKHVRSIWRIDWRRDLLFGIAILLPTAFAGAALAADAEHGEQLAKQWCSSCHLVTSQQTASADSAPPFRTIAENTGISSGNLRAWLADPHPPMPDLSLSVREIDDLTAYVMSLDGD
jgi:mono/diheme cytochrome c family protein